MTVNSTNYIKTSNGNGVATSFPYNFKIVRSTDLVVVHTDASGNPTTLVEGTDYSVSGVGKEAGGSVSFPLVTSTFSTLASGETLTKYRTPPVTQTTDLRNQGNWNPETVEDAVDLIIMILQRYTSAPVVNELDTNAFNGRSLRAGDFADPVNQQDLTTRSWVTTQLAAISSAVYGETPEQWSGTTDGSAAYTLTPTSTSTPTEDKAYLVVLGGVPQQPTTDFTVTESGGTYTLTFTSTPATGMSYWVVAMGYANPVNEYPAHDHPEVFMTYGAGGTANAITLAAATARVEATAYTDDMCGVFNPSLANTSADVTANVEGLGAKTVYLRNGTTKPPVGFLNPLYTYFFRYDSGSDTIRILYPYQSNTNEMADNAVTLDKLAHGTAGYKLGFDGSGVPREAMDRWWVEHDDSGELTSGSEYAITGIPDNATMIEIDCIGLEAASGNNRIDMQIGHGATPTYITTGYVGRYHGVPAGSATAGSVDWSSTNGASRVARAGSSSHRQYQHSKIKLVKYNDGTDVAWRIFVSGADHNGTSAYVFTSAGQIDLPAATGDLSAIKFVLAGSTLSAGQIITRYYGNPDA